ncbi:MAG: ribonuclease HII [Thermoplasmata archaeon]
MARRILGLDEAGRGSILGPLVVGGFVVESTRVRELRTLGVRDSKLLSPERRRSLYAALASLGEARSIHLWPDRIDPAVASHGLNSLEADAFAEIVRAVAPHETRADACDVDATRFGRRVRAGSGHPAPVRARHHMDRDDPVVGAASIVAKVERDREVGSLAERLTAELGSGYPSDPRTMEFVRGWIRDRGREEAPWLRRSWAPTRRLMQERSTRRLEEFER